MSILWFCIASFANWALTSFWKVTKAMPRLYRMFPVQSASTVRVQSKLRTPLNLAPLAKVPQQRFLGLILIRTLVNLGDIQRAVRPVERSNTTHVVTVLGVLFTAKAVARVVDDLVRQRKPVQKVALGTVRAATAGEEEAAEAVTCCVCTSVAGVARDHAS